MGGGGRIWVGQTGMTITGKQKVIAEVSKGRNRAPIRITKKNYLMTSKVIGVLPRWHGFTLNDDGTHHIDWRHLAAFEQSMGYPPVYMGELEEWANTIKGKAALMTIPGETVADYEQRLQAWRKRYPEWFEEEITFHYREPATSKAT
jgi:hypothetical protein